MWKLFSYIITVSIVNLNSVNVNGDSSFKQERAKVQYVNPKYVSNFTIITLRESRHAPYLTSINSTALVPVGDDFTFSFEFVNLKLAAFPLRFEFTTCEAFKMKWVKDYLQIYSDIPFVCPVPPGSYHVRKFELPPKNFPYQFTNNDYKGKLTVYITNTKERVCDISINLKGSNKS